MSDEQLEEWISLLNEGKHEDSIFLRQISNNVFIAKVWHNLPVLTSAIMSASNVYFITNSDGTFVSCVYDGVGDLHAYTSPAHRNKGNMRQALKDCILPHILHFLERKTQVITVRNDAAEKLAKEIGFVKDKGKFKIIQTAVSKFDNSFDPMTNTSLTFERAKSLRDRLNLAFAMIEKVKDELEVRYEESGNLSDVIKYRNGAVQTPLNIECIYRDLDKN